MSKSIVMQTLAAPTWTGPRDPEMFPQTIWGLQAQLKWEQFVKLCCGKPLWISKCLRWTKTWWYVDMLYLIRNDSAAFQACLSGVHFPQNLQQELFGEHRKPREKALIEGRSIRSNWPHIVGNSQSINVGTHKMVNYAWPLARLKSGETLMQDCSDFDEQINHDANASCSFFNWASRQWNFSRNVSWSPGLVQVGAAHVCIRLTKASSLFWAR